MWSVLACISTIVGLGIIIKSTQDIGFISTIIGLIILMIVAPVFLVLDYYNTETTYQVEMQTQEVLSANGKDYAIRLRIYRDGRYYDIEMPIDEYHGETELTFTQMELSKYK